jgi:toxin ParE1/3/4
MVFKIVIKPIVLLDVEEAILYYQKKLAGLGKRFYNQFLSTITHIQNKPFTFSYVKDPVRRCKIENFPYKVFYIVADDTIFILGVTHAKRSNAFVKRRLRLL